MKRSQLPGSCLASRRNTRQATSGCILAIFAPALFFFCQFLALRLQIGILGRYLPESRKEWLARFEAWGAIVTAACSLLGIVALFGPFLIDAFVAASLWKQIASGLSVVMAHVATLYSGGSSKTNGKPDPNATFGYKWLDLVGIIGAPICILILLLITAGLVDTVAGRSFAISWSAFFIALVIFLLFGFRVDINKFSMAPFYRNRLARCYLGGNNPERTPDPFTGFDEHEEAMRNTGMPLSCLLPARFGGSFARPGELCGGNRTYDGPFPIFCSTINLTFGQDLASQECKGSSFAFTPLYSGYDVGWTADTSVDEQAKPSKTTFNGFFKTDRFAYRNGGIDLPTVAAVSGAALSPNQGFTSQPALAFLMTLFNVRLGWWIANPRKPRVCDTAPHRRGLRKIFGPSPTPLFGPRYLLSELFGLANDTTNYVNLCDGGRFDNMGLFELVRRRCSLIVICDGEEDVNTTFEGIGMAVAKCRTDFGVEIALDLRPLQPDPVTKLSKAHFIIGQIQYPAPPGRQSCARKDTGKLVYLKTSLIGNESADLLHYKREHADFPQQSTLNQWFTETQFESYRKLGQLIGQEAARSF